MPWKSSHLADDSLNPSDVLDYSIAILANTKYHFAQQRQQMEIEHQKYLSRTVERDGLCFNIYQ